jgi:phospholipase/lecithinase/hemolysin
LWGGEEEGLYGSLAYVQQHFAPRDTMKKTPEYDKLDVYFNDDSGSGKFRAVSALGNAQLAAITGVNIIEFDTFDWFRNVVSNPAAFGLSNVTNPCYSGFILPDPTATVCSNPDSYLFWDREHPTRVGQSLLANQLFAAVTPVSEGSTLPLVFFGLSVLGAIRAYERRKRGVSPNVA